MAGIAIGRRPAKGGVLVAIHALDLAVRTFQGKGQRIVVERGLLPGLGRVAGGAVLAQIAPVGVVLLMAGVAVLGRGPEIGGGAGVGMAASTAGSVVGALQRKSQLVVVKSGAVAVDAVVAGQAAIAKGTAVGLHKDGIHFAVTLGTGGRIKLGHVLAVAVGADKIITPRGSSVALQGKTGGLVGKAVAREAGQRRVGASVLTVAEEAGPDAAGGVQRTVEAGRIGQLALHLHVARQAAVGHRLCTPGRRMAGRAAAANLGMGAHTAQRLGTRLGVERARGKEAAAPEQQHKGYRHHGEPRGDEALGGQAS